MLAKYGCSSGSRRFWKNCWTLPVPKQAGGRLMLWITSREIDSPSGRALKFGEGQWVIPIPWNQPVARSNCMGQILKTP
ncbi:hypothetical protein D3C84_1150210 [compost metagenome]